MGAKNTCSSTNMTEGPVEKARNGHSKRRFYVRSCSAGFSKSYNSSASSTSDNVTNIKTGKVYSDCYCHRHCPCTWLLLRLLLLVPPQCSCLSSRFASTVLAPVVRVAVGVVALARIVVIIAVITVVYDKLKK